MEVLLVIVFLAGVLICILDPSILNSSNNKIKSYYKACDDMGVLGFLETDYVYGLNNYIASEEVIVSLLNDYIKLKNSKSIIYKLNYDKIINVSILNNVELKDKVNIINLGVFATASQSKREAFYFVVVYGDNNQESQLIILDVSQINGDVLAEFYKNLLSKCSLKKAIDL